MISFKFELFVLICSKIYLKGIRKYRLNLLTSQSQHHQLYKNRTQFLMLNVEVFVSRNCEVQRFYIIETLIKLQLSFCINL